MNVALIIFDCDGVLVDSEPLANRVFAEELERLGVSMDPRAVRERFVGLSTTRCMELVAEHLGRDVPADFAGRLQARTFEIFRRELKPISGVVEALRRIDVPVCVASSGEHEKMRLTLALTGLLPRFEGRMFSATDVARGKPHPDLFLHAARQLGAAPRSCVVVEDSLPGVIAARAAGMLVLGYCGDGAAERLAVAGARAFEDMRQLPGLIQEVGGPAGSSPERRA